ncbi:MAG: hypothetical protein HY392_03695 [Candidatus Diapherotrites archaeon]|nr:hypothetical protein [Candidatus Diapherotrites archaeon]
MTIKKILHYSLVADQTYTRRLCPQGHLCPAGHEPTQGLLSEAKRPRREPTNGQSEQSMQMFLLPVC